MEVIFFVGGFIVLVVLATLYSNFQRRKRSEAWQKVAGQMNFTFSEGDASEERFSGFKIFSQGRSRSSYHCLVGKNENDEIRTLDYQYTTGHGKNSHTHYQTLCILKSKDLNLPHFFIRRENSFFDFLGKLFGGQDINFDQDPTFSKAFVLQGESESAIRDLFDPRVRRQFLQFEGTSMQVEGRGDTILFNPSEQIEPVKVGALILRAINVKKAFLPIPSNTGGFGSQL